jgi:DNA-binding NtrC family response regulator
MKELKQHSVRELIDQYLFAGLGLDEMTELFKNSVIVRALGVNHGNVSKTSEMLKIHRNTAQRFMTKYKLKKESFHENGLESSQERDEGDLEPGAIDKT